MYYKKIRKIAKGWSSNIWLVTQNNIKTKTKTTKNQVFVLKEVREKSNRKNLWEREGKMLTIANEHGIGPKLFFVSKEKNFVVMEFVKGKQFLDFVESNEFDKTSREKIYFFVKELYKQCLVLDEIGLQHSQLQVGKNILVTKKVINKKNKKIRVLFPIIIDFEKASLRNDGKQKNIGQIESFLFYNPNGFVAKKIREKLGLILEEN